MIFFFFFFPFSTAQVPNCEHGCECCDLVASYEASVYLGVSPIVDIGCKNEGNVKLTVTAAPQTHFDSSGLSTFVDAPSGVGVGPLTPHLIDRAGDGLYVRFSEPVSIKNIRFAGFSATVHQDGALFVNQVQIRCGLFQAQRLLRDDGLRALEVQGDLGGFDVDVSEFGFVNECHITFNGVSPTAAGGAPGFAVSSISWCEIPGDFIVQRQLKKILEQEQATE